MRISLAAQQNASVLDDNHLEDEHHASTALRRVLIVGAGLAGLAAVRELRGRFRVTVVDAKEYFEFTPSVMRAYVQPCYWDCITFLYKSVLERTWRVKFICGEVVKLDGDAKCAHVQSVFASEEDVVQFEYCIVASGCKFDPFRSDGESIWSPVTHHANRLKCEFCNFDERYLEGRRRHILEEYRSLTSLNRQRGSVLIVGAGYLGVQWACELQQTFPGLRITITDVTKQCLEPLPDLAATYCQAYMEARGIRTLYKTKYNPNSLKYWHSIGHPRGVDKTYILSGSKQSNHFMPPSALSRETSHGGGWININNYLQVEDADGGLLGDGCIFSLGDCIHNSLSAASTAQAVPKNAYAAEQQAVVACQNVVCLDRQLHGGGLVWACCLPFPAALARRKMKATWYPWGSGIVSLSLGSQDGCLVVGNNSNEWGSGRVWAMGQLAVAHKELIETTKLAQCRGDHWISHLIWHLIHHCPLNFVGGQNFCLDLSLLSRQ